MRRSSGRRAAPLVVAVVLAAACSSPHATPAPTTAAPTSTTTSTTVAPPPTVAGAGPRAPLTGEPVGTDPAVLTRPALAIKVDNAREAMPQRGLNAADEVIEVKVEGISRLMAVYQSRDPGEVGPTRSARYSDPDLLALFGRPLFAWSGANDGVSSAVARASWIVNVNWDRVGASEYHRRADKAGPHNLYTNTNALFRHAKPDQGAPPPQFFYAGAGLEQPPPTPTPGVSLNVGDTPSTWVWDAAGARWLRWQYGVRHESEGAGQVSASNVVVLETRYSGGSKTPTANSIGSGRAVVFTAGGRIEGRWTRSYRASRYSLTTAGGRPILVAPGRTWVELTSGPTWRVLPAETASGLLATGR